MLNLKGPYDVVTAAEAAWKTKAAEIAALLEQGDDEATKQALALQESLNGLQADYHEKLSLYESLVSANAPSAVNQLFVPASPTPSTPDLEQPKSVMKLAEFHNLSAKERMDFVKAGGKTE